MKIYLAHQITGLGYDEVVGYYQGLVGQLRDWGYTPLQPMTAKGYLRNEVQFKAHGYDKHPASTNHAILERDNWMVGQADVVLVDLSGARAVSIGCMMELAWAHQLRKHTVVVIEQESIHRHAFVLEAADVVFETLEDAKHYLELLIKQEVA